MSAPRRRSWFAERDGTLGDVLAALGEDAAGAVRDGRVFIGRTRARDAKMRVAKGTRVDVTAASAEDNGAPRPRARVVELGRTADWIAVDKPAGVPTIADQASASDCLHAWVAAHVGRETRDVHPTSRLDRDVSGVVTFALTAHGRDTLLAAREAGQYERRYIALAHCVHNARDFEARGVWDAPIGRAASPLLRAAHGREAKVARSEYAVLSNAAPYLALEVFPRTGRTHQIRVHCAHAGAPLLGDASYGGPRSATTASGRVVGFDRIFLHAHEVRVAGAHYVSPLPAAMSDAWRALTGSDLTAVARAR